MQATNKETMKNECKKKKNQVKKMKKNEKNYEKINARKK